MTFKISTRIEGDTCEMTVVRLSSTAVLLRISGNDIGEFQDMPMRCVDAFLSADAPVQLFVDAREAAGVAMSVSGAWSAWLEKRKDRFEKIHFLASRPYVAVSAQFVRRFSGLQQTMLVYEDPALFDSQMLRAAAGNYHPRQGS